MVAGLGAITPASGYVGPLGGLSIGISAGIVCYYATQYLKRSLKIDDSLDVFPVHGVGGILGTFLTAIFYARGLGGLSGDDYAVAGQLITQLTGIVATIAWCAIASFLLLKIIDAVIGLRVSQEEETEGLDLVSHNERGYTF